MNIAALATGLVGLSASTWVFPWLARLREPMQRPTNTPAEPGEIEILIPAHDEEATIAATLDSIRRAVARLRETDSRWSARVRVGADNCSDRTAEIARATGGGVEDFAFRSKWRTLSALTATSRAARVAWVDAGTIWPDDLLLRVTEAWSARAIGVAVAYRPRRSGILHRLLWELEAMLKNLENDAGGPVSVHGATVFYDGDLLRRELASLAVKDWRNDDVIVPYSLRARHADRPLVYLTRTAVDDAGLGRTSSDTRRRLRLVEGNVEIFRAAFFDGPHTPRGSANLLLSRRMARALWAWWILALAGGAFGALAALGLLAFAVLSARRPLGAAFLASLAMPALVAFPRLGRRLPWN